MYKYLLRLKTHFIIYFSLLIIFGCKLESNHDLKNLRKILLPLILQSNPKLKIIVPAYFSNSDYWSILLNSADNNFLIILNPSNGPGSSVDSFYQESIKKLKEKGSNVVGYVFTNYGERDISDVKTDIDQWISFYPNIDGFFLDEAASNNTKIANYKQLFDYIKNKNSQLIVLLNHGIVPEENYFKNADVNVIFEEKSDLIFNFNPPFITRNYDRFHYALIVHTASRELVDQILEISYKKNIGYIYITDDIEPNPYDSLPSYWDYLINYFYYFNIKVPF